MQKVCQPIDAQNTHTKTDRRIMHFQLTKLPIPTSIFCLISADPLVLDSCDFTTWNILIAWHHIGMLMK